LQLPFELYFSQRKICSKNLKIDEDLIGTAIAAHSDLLRAKNRTTNPKTKQQPQRRKPRKRARPIAVSRVG